MTVSVDLISDLHVESWDQFDWSGQATSPYCIVAGDVARNREQLLEALEHLGKCYPGGVFYVDGNEEHRDYYHDLGASYQDLAKDIESIPKVVFMQDQVIILRGVAFLGTNAWWTYDFNPELDLDLCVQSAQDHFGISNAQARNISSLAYNDADYFKRSVRRLQTHKEVAKVVLISHTVPAPWLISHDIDLAGHLRYNGMGCSPISSCIDEDTEHKIHTWCFGHYHRPVDQDLGGVRYVCNPRGRGGTPWSQHPYYPKRIEIDF